MKKFLKWLGIAVAVAAVAGFLAFLYFIPPFDSIPPEEISRGAGEAGPDLAAIADPGERAIAERGRYLVTIGSCADCHATPGPQGPQLKEMYLAGGMKVSRRGVGTHISMNLTPDAETGLGKWSDDDIKRVLRNGLAPDGRAIPGHVMPWPAFSNWTEEDRHAVVTYLRHTRPIAHRIPTPTPDVVVSDPTAQDEGLGGKDYAAADAR
ncbi:MAG: c-type cytochrome [Vicinamibacterales bacterium]|nr:c-type cytochrome [Vicinamibacterales bacterium]